ncbi:hypothetical protein BD289DRAFT_41070 [Coniella lustricola]|uniref:Uncharacterized protein n=1 Tax=Coniella lustricola TaxID=2025994 RepID=A0A2T3A256_9PEZI|nr:hypothetical protein BD289DRAFT_41070 [Coniella lustricola]
MAVLLDLVDPARENKVVLFDVDHQGRPAAAGESESVGRGGWLGICICIFGFSPVMKLYDLKSAQISLNPSLRGKPAMAVCQATANIASWCLLFSDCAQSLTPLTCDLVIFDVRSAGPTLGAVLAALARPEQDEPTMSVGAMQQGCAGCTGLRSREDYLPWAAAETHMEDERQRIQRDWP